MSTPYPKALTDLLDRSGVNIDALPDEAQHIIADALIARAETGAPYEVQDLLARVHFRTGFIGSITHLRTLGLIDQGERETRAKASRNIPLDAVRRWFDAETDPAVRIRLAERHHILKASWTKAFTLSVLDTGAEICSDVASLALDQPKNTPAKVWARLADQMGAGALDDLEAELSMTIVRHAHAAKAVAARQGAPDWLRLYACANKAVPPPLVREVLRAALRTEPDVRFEWDSALVDIRHRRDLTDEMLAVAAWVADRWKFDDLAAEIGDVVSVGQQGLRDLAAAVRQVEDEGELLEEIAGLSFAALSFNTELFAAVAGSPHAGVATVEHLLGLREADLDLVARHWQNWHLAWASTELLLSLMAYTHQTRSSGGSAEDVAAVEERAHMLAGDRMRAFTTEAIANPAGVLEAAWETVTAWDGALDALARGVPLHMAHAVRSPDLLAAVVKLLNELSTYPGAGAWVDASAGGEGPALTVGEALDTFTAATI